MHRTIVVLALGLAPWAPAQAVDPSEDEARIEVLIAARANLQLEREVVTATPDATVLPPPVAPVLEETVHIPPGRIEFAQLATLKGRWISVRMRSGSVRRGQLLGVKGSDVMLKIGAGAQGATLPLNRKNITSLELLQ